MTRVPKKTEVKPVTSKKKPLLQRKIKDWWSQSGKDAAEAGSGDPEQVDRDQDKTTVLEVCPIGRNDMTVKGPVVGARECTGGGKRSSKKKW